MRNKGLVVLLFICLMVGSANFSGSYDGLPIAQHIEDVAKIAGDGDLSSESITSFAETLPDDTLYYPDAFTNGTDYADAGDAGPNIEETVADTQSVDAVYYSGRSDSAGVLAELWLNFTTPAQVEKIEWFIYWGQGFDDIVDLWLWNYTAGDWLHIADCTGDTIGWENDSSTSPDYWTDGVVMLYMNSSDADDGAYASIDYAELNIWQMTLASDGYAESFADVSDWTQTAGSLGVSSNGDYATFIPETDNNWDWWKVADFTTMQNVQCGEIRFKANVSSGNFIWRAYDGATITGINEQRSASTTWETRKLYGYANVTDFFIVCKTTNSVPVEFYVDYVRLGDDNATGWQHDGATIEGVTEWGDTIVTSDGDNLNVSIASGQNYFYVTPDTTSTMSKIDPDYYPLLHIRFTAASIGSKFALYSYDGSLHLLQVDSVISKQDYYYNIKAGVSNDIYRFYCYTFASYGSYEIEFMKAYSIANYSYAASASLGTDEYAYVSNGALIVTKDSTNWMGLYNDPALTVATATYTVWNITANDLDPRGSGGTSFNFQCVVGGSLESHTDETRGTWDHSGTLSDFALVFYHNTGDMIITAIKFIEDATAPDADIVVSPSNPDDDESITLSSIVFDTVEVYKVWYNAITYPAGFSDLDYAATEGQENYWSYTFSAGELPHGDYCFKVIANDGANNSTITQSNRDYATVRFTVREATIIIQEITLIGAGSDFSMMTFSARINRDCSYTIYEESANNPETDTYTGSVSAPSFNIAWTKLSTTDSNVNFTIKFVNGSLTYNYTSQYQVAQTTFYISNGGVYSSVLTVTAYGRITKLGTYTVYVDDSEETSGTLTNLGFLITWDNSLHDGRDHDAAIKFVNGSQTCWLNGTFYSWQHDPDQAAPPFDPGEPSDRKSIEFWSFIGAILAGLGFLAIAYNHFARRK